MLRNLNLTPLRGAILALAVLALTAGPAVSSSLLELDPMTPEEILLAQRAIEDTGTVAPPSALEPPSPASGALPPGLHPAASAAHKKPGIGVLLSLAVPGAGHLYAGEKRGWINIGVDVVSWAAYVRYRDLGRSKEDGYEDFADSHWDYNRWLSQGQSAGCAECFPGSPEDSLLLAFRDRNRQHYYEDIGKISTYFYGWDDWAQNNPGDPADRGESANRLYYRGMRNHSNNFLKNSRYSFTAAMVNRVISAVDAFRILKRRATPQLGENTHLRIQFRTKPFSEETRLGFVVTKRL